MLQMRAHGLIPLHRKYKNEYFIILILIYIALILSAAASQLDASHSTSAYSRGSLNYKPIPSRI